MHFEFDDDNELVRLLAYAYAGAVSVLPIILGPFIIGVLVDHKGLSESAAGFLLSIELTGYLAGTVISTFALQRLNWRIYLMFSVFISVSGNLMSIQLDSYILLAALRFITGLSVSVLMTVSVMSISTLSDTDRGYGCWTVAQILLGGIAILIVPMIDSNISGSSPFVTMILFLLLVFPVVRLFPTTGKKKKPTYRHNSYILFGVLALAGIASFYTGQAAIWSFLERIGNNLGWSAQSIGQVMSLAMIAALIAAIFATWLGNRVGRAVPIVFSFLCSGAGAILLWKSDSLVLFALGASIFNIGWYFSLPYFTSVIASLDASGRLLSGLPFFYCAAGAAGPALAAASLGVNGYSSILWFGVISIIPGLLVPWVTLQLDRLPALQELN